MRYKLITFFLLFFLIFSFSVSAQYLEVALVSDIGGFGDNSYNDQLRSSLNKANNEFNLSLEFKESKLMSEYLENINNFAENKYDLIWGLGFTMEQAIKEAAQMYPDTDFVIFDGIVKEENVMSLTFKKEEAAFLAGVIAALESESSAVAFIGAKDNKELRHYQLGFESGVKAVNSEMNIFSKYLGSFNDFSAAKELSSELVAKNNVDIIFYAAGAASKGVIETAVEKDINLISLDAGDIELAPNNVLTAILKNTDQIVNQIIKAHSEDTAVNEIKEYGLADNAFILETNQAEKMIKKETLKKIEEYKQQFITGEIRISSLP